MNDLVSMRYIFVTKGSLSTNVGEMSGDHNVQNGMDQNYKCSELEQLQSMNKVVQLGVFHLVNISKSEADGAKLRDKQQLEMLHLSWNNTLSQYDSDTEEEEEDDDDENCSETEAEESRTVDGIGQDSGPLIDRETEMESSQMNGTNDNSPISGHFIKMAEEVLEGLQPHDKLKHLQISGYSGSIYAWLATVTCLQTLHLEDCGEWQILPALEKFPFLTKLTLRNMRKVREVSIPSLEELVLIKMPKLTSCRCSSLRGLNSSLRVLKIQRCRVLKIFPLFGRDEELNIEKMPWLSHLIELTIHHCPHLMVPYPLPHSDAVALLSIFGVTGLPKMKGSSRGTLTIGFIDKRKTLDCNVLAFHNLRLLSHLIIDSCDIELTTVVLEGFSQLINLQRLEMNYSEAIFPADIVEDMAPANFAGLRSLKHLTLLGCTVEWIWLSGMLRHVKALEELYLDRCGNLTAVTLEDEETSQANLSSAPEASTSENPDRFLLRISSNIISSLRQMSIVHCDPTFCGRKDGFSRFTCLEYLQIWGCPNLISSLVHKAENNETSERWLLPNSLGKLAINFSALLSHEIPDSPKTLQLCFPDNLTCLQNLTVFCSPSLRSLQLNSCTALEELHIYDCKSLTALEGLEILCVLRNLKVSKCPGFPRCLVLPRQGFDLRRLRLEIGDCDILTTSFCSHLASLQRLQFYNLPQVTRLTDAQESALPLLTSLQELSFWLCCGLEDLPKGLHSLRSLKRLEISHCRSIERLPETGLPPTLEELDVSYCSEELTEQCRELATSKVKVKIDGKYVN